MDGEFRGGVRSGVPIRRLQETTYREMRSNSSGCDGVTSTTNLSRGDFDTDAAFHLAKALHATLASMDTEPLSPREALDLVERAKHTVSGSDYIKLATMVAQIAAEQGRGEYSKVKTVSGLPEVTLNDVVNWIYACRDLASLEALREEISRRQDQLGGPGTPSE